MQLGKLVQAERVIQSLSHEKMGVGLSYKLMKLLKSMNDDKEFYYNEVDRIIDKYALRNESGEIIKNQDGNVPFDMTRKEELEEDSLQLNQTEVEIPNIKLRLEELQDLKLSVNDMIVLDDFIEEV